MKDELLIAVDKTVNKYKDMECATVKYIKKVLSDEDLLSIGIKIEEYENENNY